MLKIWLSDWKNPKSFNFFLLDWIINPYQRIEDWYPWDLIDNQIQPEQPEKGLVLVYPDHPKKGWYQMDKRRNLYILYV